MKKWFYSIVLLVSLVFLCGCEQKTNVNFSRNEQWTWKTSIDFDAGLVRDVGSIAGSLMGEFVGSEIPSGLFNVELYLNPIMNMMKNTLRSQGVKFDWDYNGEKLTYEMSGKTYDFLERNGFITAAGSNQYRLTVSSEDMITILDPEYQQMLMQLNEVFGNNEVQIIAGEIIQSNADVQTKTKATWYNPNNINVVFIPGSSMNAGLLLILLIGIVLIFILTLLLGKKSGKSTCPYCGAKVRRKATDCPHCGSYLGID